MKPQIILYFTLFFALKALNAQEAKTETQVKSESKLSYYQKRAKQDAEFEQTFKASSKKENTEFWDEQKKYEKELKRKDKAAYNAYMKGKKVAYKEHQKQCTHEHSHHYHSHASFYYQYNSTNNTPSRNRTRILINARTPRVRLGLF